MRSGAKKDYKDGFSCYCFRAFSFGLKHGPTARYIECSFYEKDDEIELKCIHEEEGFRCSHKEAVLVAQMLGQ